QLLRPPCAVGPSTFHGDAATERRPGPFGGTAALALRRSRRSLRAAAHAGGEDAPEQPLAAVLADPRELTLLHGHAADSARRVAGLLRLARETAKHGNAHEVLWAVWDASGLVRGMQAPSAAGG